MNRWYCFILRSLDRHDSNNWSHLVGIWDDDEDGYRRWHTIDFIFLFRFWSLLFRVSKEELENPYVSWFLFSNGWAWIVSVGPLWTQANFSSLNIGLRPRPVHPNSSNAPFSPPLVRHLSKTHLCVRIAGMYRLESNYPTNFFHSLHDKE